MTNWNLNGFCRNKKGPDGDGFYDWRYKCKLGLSLRAGHFYVYRWMDPKFFTKTVTIHLMHTIDRNVASAYWIDTKSKILGNSTDTLQGILQDSLSKGAPLVTVSFVLKMYLSNNVAFFWCHSLGDFIRSPQPWLQCQSLKWRNLLLIQRRPHMRLFRSGRLRGRP